MKPGRGYIKYRAMEFPPETTKIKIQEEILTEVGQTIKTRLNLRPFGRVFEDLKDEEARKAAKFEKQVAEHKLK